MVLSIPVIIGISIISVATYKFIESICQEKENRENAWKEDDMIPDVID